MTAAALKTERRWLVPEVVQTSMMDCGPAALKCLLEGHHVSASYGRLREACQTDVDGTSIDTIETIASDLGMEIEQCLIPVDHVMLPEANALPAIVVVSKMADGATHFVVVWRRHGNWLQIMDPGVGRRWMSVRSFRDEIYKHSARVEASAWRSWAETSDFTAPLKARLGAIGIAQATSDALIFEALANPAWFPIGALDATVRLVQSLIAAKGVNSGAEAETVLRALYRDTLASTDDVFKLVPPSYWSAMPDVPGDDPSIKMLSINGSVLLRVGGMRDKHAAAYEDEPQLSPELAAALSEKPTAPLQSLWTMLREDGLLAPLALVAAMAVAAAALMLEVLLFRGIFDIAALLTLPSQRLFAGLSLLIFVAILLGIEVLIALGTLRLGRQLELRLRMALLRKLPKLNDRYFQSRPITDMADRNHNIHAMRGVPSTGLQFVQSAFELTLTFLGVVLIAPEGWWIAVALVGAAIGMPFVTQSLLNERDLRVRSHAGALHGYYLDALIGLAPVRAHRAERSVQGQHEGLLVEWTQSLRGLIQLTILSDGAQAVICTALAATLLIVHFMVTGQVSGSDLLLVYWTLKLPAIGSEIAGLAHQYPAQRNILLRMLEPLSAPEDIEDQDAPSTNEQAISLTATQGVGIQLDNGSVIAGGHDILRDVTLAIAPGEHVAIVGMSGAGKSTLLSLLLGWHRLSNGQLHVDGVRCNAAAIEDLRRVTAWVDPAIQIWNRSLIDNLSYASRGDGFERIGDVIEAAKLRGVAQKLPQGLQTLLGEGGGLLSGGEGQRVRLGRALLARGTRLALLDEPFRGMDRTQRQTLLGEARVWWKDVTLLCVTHDVSETLTFPRVLVVENGQIIEDGSPTRLASQASRYQELLAAEAMVNETIWRGDYWRRVEISEGRLRDQKLPA